MPLLIHSTKRGLMRVPGGGKILGAGGGGCLLFVVDPSKQEALKHALKKVAEKAGLSDFQETPFNFTEGGAEVLFNHMHRVK